jgi:hypothetical protein
MRASALVSKLALPTVVCLASLIQPGGAAADTTLTTVHSFTSIPDGERPRAGLIFDKSGALYGTTFLGGSATGCDRVSGCGGTVFKLTPLPDGTWTESVLHSFTGPPDGAFPQAGLIFDEAGALYGTTAGGGTGCAPSDPLHSGGCGTVFKLTPLPDGTWTERVLYSFTVPPDGSFPQAGLILDERGALYGTTSLGGTSTACTPDGCGTVFKLVPPPIPRNLLRGDGFDVLQGELDDLLRSGFRTESVLYNSRTSPTAASPAPV